MINLYTKYEVSRFTHCEDMKGDKICKNWGGLGVRGHPRSLETSPFDRVHMTSYSTILYRFWVIARFSSKVTNFTHLTCTCRPRRGWSRSNFAMIFGIKKLESWRYRAALYAWSNLRLAVLIQYRSVTDRHTHTHTDWHTTTAYTALSIASRGKNQNYKCVAKPSAQLARHAP